MSVAFAASPARARRIRTIFAFIVGYTVLAVVLTHPLIRQVATRVPHDLGDPLMSTTVLWWNAHSAPLSAAWWNSTFFFPATGTLALSDHRLGESVIASPLQWAGLGPLAAYNLTLLALFPLSALAAHWLAFTLTRRHDAALVAGLAYGFSPYRFAHIEHLELLAAFGMPAALAALHHYLADRRARWLVVFGAALFVQALSCSYYFLFFLVLLAGWIVWFLRGREHGILAGIGVAGAAASAAMAPIGLRYAAIHAEYGLQRSINDIVELSADVTSIVTASPLSAVWGWTAPLNGSERQLFPGATVLAVVAVALVASARTRPVEVGSRASKALLAAAGAFAAIAASALWLGPWRIGPVSVGTPVKPFSLAFAALLGAFACSRRVRDARGRRSPFAFYVLAAGAAFMFGLGPKPAFLHHQFLYQPPYAWLMLVPPFRGGVRVPARFGMLMILALSAAAALAFDRVGARRSRSMLLAGVVAGILADSWVSGLALLDPPPPLPARATTLGAAAFVDLPLGDVMVDSAAMFRAVPAGLPTANGNSGYAPPHYAALRVALESHDETALEALAAYGPLLVAVERARPGAAGRLEWLRGYRGASEIWTDADATWFVVGAHPQLPAVDCHGPVVPIAAVRDARGPVPLAALLDGNRNTFWTTGAAQRAGDALVVDLGHVARPCSVRVSLGARSEAYPNALSVATSADGATWQTTMIGKTGGLAVAALLARPLGATIELPVPDAPARFIALRIEADQPKAPWIVAELAVVGR